MEFYRKYMLVFISAHATTLMALSDKEDVSERVTYENSMQEEIKNFKSFIKNKIDNIIKLWITPKTYGDNCVKTATKYFDSNGKIGWEFVPGPYEWGTCKWKVAATVGPNAQNFCKRFVRSVTKSINAISVKARQYWQSYQNKLFGSSSVFTKVEKMVASGKFGNNLLQKIKDQVKQESNTGKIPDVSEGSGMETDD